MSNPGAEQDADSADERLAGEREVPGELREPELPMEGHGGGVDGVGEEEDLGGSLGAGDRDALLMLGTLYARGEGVAADASQALWFWRAAATRGHPVAMFCIGEAHVAGDSVPADVATAAEWYLLAAGAGNEEAVQALARVLPQVRAAAETGPPAAAWVASSFVDDPVESGRLLALAAAKGHGRACHRLATLIRRDKAPGGVERMITLLQQGAAAGSEDAQHDLAFAYNSGTGLPQDRRLAVDWYRKAAKRYAGTPGLYSREGVLEEDQKVQWRTTSSISSC